MKLTKLIIFSAASLCLLGIISPVQGRCEPVMEANCTTLSPNVGGKPKSGSMPYTIDLPSTEVKPGQLIRIVLRSSKRKDKFQGFYVQARRMFNGKRHGLMPFGYFFYERGHEKWVHVFKCGRWGFQNTISHEDMEDKSEVKFLWRAPMFPGDYVFLYTVMKNRSTFWVAHRSKKITVKGNLC